MTIYILGGLYSMNHKLLMKSFSLILILLPLLTSCKRPVAPISKSAFYLDTYVQITVYDNKDQTALDEAVNLCEMYDELLSISNPESDIYQINHAKGAWVPVNPKTYELLKYAYAYCEQTDGLIDITIYPAKILWNFKQNTDQDTSIPDSQAIATALTSVDYHLIQFDDQTLSIQLSDPAAGIDLGCIGKGFIADEITSTMKSAGVKSGMVDLGGNVAVIGNKPDNTPYTVGIRKPFDSSASYLDTVSCSDKSVVTSGIYERYFMRDNKLYHHILDPKTGYPAETDLISVTIITAKSVDADVLSTYLLMLGEQGAKTFLSKHTDYQVVLINQENRIIKVNF